jgi:Glycosyl hydrolases family 43
MNSQQRCKLIWDSICSFFHGSGGNGKAALIILVPMLVWLAGAPARGLAQVIQPGEVWRDDRGQPIQAHGGGILKRGHTYFWFGEEREQGLDPAKKYVGCYSSQDLVHWKFRNLVIKLSDPENFGPRWLLERPKVFYNAKTKKYVMYMHIDGPVNGSGSGYALARVGVATSDKVDGDYHYIRSFRPLGHESRDIGQFVDDDGTAYLIFEDRPFGFRIAKLSADYLDVEKEIALIPMHLEGGAVVHYQGLYYAIGSALTGWAPNPNKYATATSLSGPWSEFKDIAPPETKTYGSQSTMMLKVVGSKTTTVIFMGDIWKPKTLWDSRYLWMPLKIGDGQLSLPDPKPWKLNVKTGEAEVVQ